MEAGFHGSNQGAVGRDEQVTPQESRDGQGWIFHQRREIEVQQQGPVDPNDDHMDNVNAVGIFVECVPKFFAFIWITPEAFNHDVQQTNEREVKTYPPDEPLERYNCKTFRVERPQAGENMDGYRDPGDRIYNDVERFDLGPFGKYVLTETMRSQQVGHEIDQQSFIHEIDQSSKRPVAETEQPANAETVDQRDQESDQNSTLD